MGIWRGRFGLVLLPLQQPWECDRGKVQRPESDISKKMRPKNGDKEGQTAQTRAAPRPTRREGAEPALFLRLISRFVKIGFPELELAFLEPAAALSRRFLPSDTETTRPQPRIRVARSPVALG